MQPPIALATTVRSIADHEARADRRWNMIGFLVLAVFLGEITPIVSLVVHMYR
jgi:hypothetical protein